MFVPWDFSRHGSRQTLSDSGHSLSLLGSVILSPSIGLRAADVLISLKMIDKDIGSAVRVVSKIKQKNPQVPHNLEEIYKQIIVVLSAGQTLKFILGIFLHESLLVYDHRRLFPSLFFLPPFPYHTSLCLLLQSFSPVKQYPSCFLPPDFSLYFISKKRKKLEFPSLINLF
jgi:hypothetical protein